MNDRTLIWDIEASDLKADWGRILCIGWKYHGEPASKTQVGHIWDRRYHGKTVIDDAPLLRAFWPILVGATASVTYFGQGYDYPFLQAKALRYRIGGVPRGRPIDLYRFTKPYLLLRSRRLANVARFVRLRNQKTGVDGEIWQLAEAGDRKSAQYVIDHCRKDVNLLEEYYNLMAPIVHPWGRCPQCKSLRRVSNGLRPFQGKPSRRIWCQSCGMWERRPA